MRPVDGVSPWKGRTAVCIASGPSLTPEDCETVCISGHPVIVTNTTFRLCLWADALFAFDTKWWAVYHEEVGALFRGRRLSASPVAERYGAEIVARRYTNSGACAASWSIDQGAEKIVLLAYDGALGPNGETHHHGDHPEGLRNADSIEDWPRQFAILAKDAARLGVPIVNASRRTSLTAFPVVTLEDAL